MTAAPTRTSGTTGPRQKKSGEAAGDQDSCTLLGFILTKPVVIVGRKTRAVLFRFCLVRKKSVFCGCFFSLPVRLNTKRACGHVHFSNVLNKNYGHMSQIVPLFLPSGMKHTCPWSSSYQISCFHLCQKAYVTFIIIITHET